MKLLRCAVGVILALPLLAQPQAVTTTIQDTVFMADGSLGQGSIIIDFPYYCTGPGGATINVTHFQVAVIAGNFTTRLVPNDTCNSTYYIATYQLNKGSQTRTQVEYWIVPTSDIPVSIDAIRTNAPSPPAYQMPLSQLTGGTARGDLILYNGFSWQAAPRCSDGVGIASDSGNGVGWRCTPRLMNIATGEIDFSLSGWTRPWRVGNGLPPTSACTSLAHAGRVWFRLDTSAPNASLYTCANVKTGAWGWELPGGGGGSGGGGGGGGISDAYAAVTNGTDTISATGSDTLWLRSGPAISIALVSNDPTYGDNALFTLNPGSITTNYLSTSNTAGGGFHLTIDPADITKIKYLNPAQVRMNIGAAATLHGAQHLIGGSDPVATVTPVANGIPGANSSGKITFDWFQLAQNRPSWTNLTWPTNYFKNIEFNTGPGVIPVSERHVSGATEGLVSTMDIPANASTDPALGRALHASAIAGYARNAAPSANRVEGGVGVYGMCSENANDVANCWGANFVVNNFGFSGGGALFAAENNVNITAPTSGATPRYAFGTWTIGASNAQASIFSAAHQVEALGAFQDPVVPWSRAFGTGAGAASVGLYLHTALRGNNQPSQPIQLIDTFGGTEHTSSLNAYRGTFLASSEAGATFTSSNPGEMTARFQSTNSAGYSGIHLVDSTGALVAHFGYGNSSAPNLLVRGKVVLGSVAPKDLTFSTGDSLRGVLTLAGKWGFGNTAPLTSGTGLWHATGNTFRAMDALRTPASATDTGYTGEMTFDASNLWLATANNNWKRTPLYNYGDPGPLISPSPPTDDTVLAGNGTQWVGENVPDCTAGTQALNRTRGTNTWRCDTVSGTGTGVPTQSVPFTAVTTFSFDNTVHACGHGNIEVHVQEQRSSTDYIDMPGAEVHVNPLSPYTVTVGPFPSARTGRAIYACWGGASSGGAGDVSGGTASATGEMAVYGDTTGKAITRSLFILSGPATSAKTYTFPNASATILTTNAAVTVGQGGTGINSGVSGGVPYFSATSTMASSPALGANLPVIGGGPGAAPATGTRQGNTTAFVTYAGSAPAANDCAKFDASGNITTAGAACGSGGGGSGDVTGGSASATGELAAYSSTTGKGIGRSFASFSGPASTVKTYALPNANASILTDAAVVTVPQGGTGAPSLTGLLQGNGASAITAITNSITAGQALRVTGSNTYGWGSIDLANTNAVTGVLPDANIASTLARDSEVAAAYQPLDAALTALAAGSDFTQFTGPTTSTKIFTLPNANSTILTTNAAVTVGQGGTGAATLSGVLKGNGTSAIGSAAFGDVVGLFGSGSCSGYLKSNGTCDTPAGGVTTIASGTAALGTGSIASGACATAVTATATGVVTTDVINWTPNGDITAVTGYAPTVTGGLAIYPYPSANAVNFKVCNYSAAAITPGAATLNWRVAR
jgi:hypothetical protein